MKENESVKDKDNTDKNGNITNIMNKNIDNKNDKNIDDKNNKNEKNDKNEDKLEKSKINSSALFYDPFEAKRVKDTDIQTPLILWSVGATCTAMVNFRNPLSCPLFLTAVTLLGKGKLKIENYKLSVFFLFLMSLFHKFLDKYLSFASFFSFLHVFVCLICNLPFLLCFLLMTIFTI